MSSEHPLLVCTCPLCHTWRRVGLLLTRVDVSAAFRDCSLRRIRELFTELLDVADGLVVGAGVPLAGGAIPYLFQREVLPDRPRLLHLGKLP